MANAAKSTKLKVLYGEGDAEIFAAQVPVLQQAGHEVQTAEGRKAIEATMKQGGFDLVLLGATLSRNDRHHLPYMVKKFSPNTRVLVMHTDGERHPYVDGNIDTGRSMADMVAKIASVWSLANSQAPASKGAAAGR